MPRRRGSSRVSENLAALEITPATAGAMPPVVNGGLQLMVFKLVMAAARTWRRLKGENQLPKVIEGVRFEDGIEVTTVDAKDAA